MNIHKTTSNYILEILDSIKTWFSDSQYAYAEVKSYGNTPFRPTGIYHGRLHGRGYINSRCSRNEKLHS